MNDNNRPRHSLNSRYEDFDLDFDLDEENVVGPYNSRGLGKVEENESDDFIDADYTDADYTEDDYFDDREPDRAAGKTAGATAAAGTAASLPLAKRAHDDEEIFANDGQPADKETNGLPVRGLIMILAAIGILLIAWGAFKLVGNDDDKTSNTAAESSDTAGQDSANADAQKQDAAAKDSSRNQDNQGADKSDAAKHDAAPDQADKTENPQGNEGADGAKPGVDDAQTGASINPAKEYIAVLNNSPIQGLASDVSGKIRKGDFKTTGYGNLPDETFPESVVLYPGDNDSARKAADDLANQLGIRAEARTPETDRAIDNAQMLEGGKPGQIVVITTNNMPR